MRDNPLQPDFFQGHLSLERGDGWIKPWRLPHDRRALFPSPDDALMASAEHASGVRLRFATASTALGLRFLPLGEGPPADGRGHFCFDATVDGKLVATAAALPGAEEVLVSGLPEGEKVVELWLPQEIPVSLRGLASEDGAPCSAAADGRRRWITYGSSLTHCTRAHGPARIWPAIVARRNRLHLTSLGFAGQCHLDPQVGMAIAGQPADLITLKLGINCMPGGSFNARTFPAAVIGVVGIIRAAHPDIPIGLVSPIGYPPHETRPNAVGYTISDMREAIADAGSRFAATGDRNLYCFDGLDVFGLDLIARYAEDECHPDGDGIEVMGDNFDRVVMQPLLAACG